MIKWLLGGVLVISLGVWLFVGKYFVELDPASALMTPTGEAIPLTGAMADYMGAPNTVMDLDEVNVEGLIANSGVKNQQPAELYQAKSVVDVRLLFNSFAPIVKERGEPERAQAMKVIAEAATTKAVFKRPAHQFLIDGKLTNRVFFYGADNELENGPGHQYLDQIAHDVDMPLVKVMTQFSKAQGGDLRTVLENAGGSTHIGGYTVGWQRGKPVSVRSDWPFDYGLLDDENRTYNAHLLAIDYQAGTRDTIPDKVLAAYYHNYQLWDVLTGLLVPFATSAKIKEYQDYSKNPMEMLDSASLEKLANVSATLDKEQIRFTSYCAEGVWNVANLAPNHLITKGKYPKLDAVIETFQAAPGYVYMDEKDRRQQPGIGWSHLLAQGVINQKHYESLLLTNRHTVYLDWVDDATPWKVYRPYHPEGLIGQPFHLARMVRLVIRTFYPREAVALEILKEVNALYEDGDAALRQAIETFLSGRAPNSFLGDKELRVLAMYMASGQVAHGLQLPNVKAKLFDRLGYQHIVEIEDQEKVDALFDEYVAALLDVDIFDRQAFDNKMRSLDQRMAELKIKMAVYGPEDKDTRTAEAIMPFFVWVPPQGWVFWAQFPELFDSQAIRYVATAQHYEQSQAYQEAADW